MTQSISKKSLIGVLVAGLMLCFSCGLVLNVETAWADKSSPNTFTTKPAAKAGWQQDSKGWRYKNTDGSYVKNDWKKIDGKWYHFNSSAYMQTGWFKDGASWYYLGTNGKMTAGWQKVGGKWYYMANSGKMLTGWLKWDGKWYYLNSSGKMTSGWQKVSGKWYYMANSGVMQTGWKRVDGKWYYLESSGVMAANKWQGDYYLQSDGSMATNKWIGDYHVGADGKWDQTRSAYDTLTGQYVIFSISTNSVSLTDSELSFNGNLFYVSNGSAKGSAGNKAWKFKVNSNTVYGYTTKYGFTKISRSEMNNNISRGFPALSMSIENGVVTKMNQSS